MKRKYLLFSISVMVLLVGIISYAEVISFNLTLTQRQVWGNSSAWIHGTWEVKIGYRGTGRVVHYQMLRPCRS